MKFVVLLVSFVLFGEAFGGGSTSKENKTINDRHKTNALAQRMSKLLSTGAYADVQFIVEEGDKKEFLLAHKAILSYASEEFASILCIDAQNSSHSNESAETIKTVLLVTDVPIEALQVILSFIYTEDLKGLTAQNLLGVLFAAKKYKIIGLINACVTFPISHLPNIFEAFHLARLLDLEEFDNRCLDFIDANVETLLKTNEFLQIDQQFLCEIFGRETLQIEGEISLWNAALRWADAQCHQNGTECSAENRRALLGAAVDKIRFPLIKKDDFSKIIVPSGVLTSEEVIRIYQIDPKSLGKKRNRSNEISQSKTEQRRTFLHILKTKCFETFFGQTNNSLAHRMKELLRNGTFADVHFWIEEGEETKLLPAHKAIISVASDPLKAFLHFEALKMGDAAEKTSDQSITITNMSISAFNVLLQFIYTDDFGGLNGENWALVINAAKMYQLTGLVEACVTFPISHLPNIFEAFHLARLLDLEEFANRCLDFIDANVETLLKTNEFLQIDQQFLCEIFGRETLQIEGEISLWNAALRWADAQCLRNGTECSAENRRAALGAAVDKIRFPLIKKETFTENIVPSGVLTPKEVISIYQFHAHPELIGAPGGLPPLPFAPFRSREKAQRYIPGGTLRLEIGKFSEFARGPVGSERLGEHMFIKGIPLQILATVTERNRTKYLGVYIKCKAPTAKGQWTFRCHSTFRMLSQSYWSKDFTKIRNNKWYFFNQTFDKYGDEIFKHMNIEDLMSEGLYNKKKDKVTLAIDVSTNEQIGS